jgi:hypothetical protein
VRKNLETRIQTVEIEFLHGVAKYMHADNKCNTEVRKKFKVSSPSVKIQNYRNNWLEHLQRMGGLEDQ